MKKGKVRSALVALVVLLAGCSSNAQYNSCLLYTSDAADE